ncbi:hypothetical protein MSG28_012669 [Choristoneura fumiferana]|uniref:Uncharacterized protein n=1 Tax=Choristoneura fumiferana TaxID=7141 RepID=A0ACC0JHK0_CHOFU|nr:hypothetical protein MSG28_012669 [Choristoneura fumiferana]
MEPLWPTGKPIPEAKLKDLKSLLHLIPQQYLSFYVNLDADKHIEDDLEGFSELFNGKKDFLFRLNPGNGPKDITWNKPAGNGQVFGTLGSSDQGLFISATGAGKWNLDKNTEISATGAGKWNLDKNTEIFVALGPMALIFSSGMGLGTATVMIFVALGPMALIFSSGMGLGTATVMICLLGLAAACLAGGIESSGSHDQGSNSWKPSNAPAFDFSTLGNGPYLAGLGQDHQALSQGHDLGQSFGHDASGGQSFDHGANGVQSFGHDAGHGYEVSEQGQPKSFDVGHGAISSFGGSGQDFSGDSYLQAAHSFGKYGQGSFNAHGDNGGQGDGGHRQEAHGYSSGYSSEQNVELNGHNEEGNQHQQQGGPLGHTQAFILHDGGNDYGHGGQEASIHDLGVQGFGGHDFGGQQGHGFDGGLGHAEPFTVGEHTDEQHPVEVPLYKHVTVPVHRTVQVNVPKPILVGIPQPYPVKVPVNKPVAVPVETEISIPIEKVVPYPVVKHVPYPVEKHVPYKVEKTVHVHVPQPYPVKYTCWQMSTPTPKSIEDVRIVGGDDIDISEAPYQVSLVNRGQHSCGGTIISEDIIVTAAHCIYGSNPLNFQVRVGSSSSQEGGTLIQVADFMYHPKFSYTKMDSDIGLLKLKTPLEFSDTVKPIGMVGHGEEIDDGALTEVSGWGAIEEGGGKPRTLQKVSVPKVNEHVCNAAYAPMYSITPRMLCAGVPSGGKDACQGDSGGPLVHNGRLAGVVSWGIGCARPTYPGVYAKVSALRTWVDDNILFLKIKQLLRV